MEKCPNKVAALIAEGFFRAIGELLDEETGNQIMELASDYTLAWADQAGVMQELQELAIHQLGEDPPEASLIN